MALTYDDVRSILEKPISKRELIEIEPGVFVKGRKYHLSKDEIKEYREEQSRTNQFPNPYKRQGPYRAIVQALIELGVDEWHSFATMRNRMREIMQSMILNNGKTVWDTFANRASRNDLSGKDLTGKIMTNTLIMQRIQGWHRYGQKLADLCACIDAKKENGIYHFRLNTQFKRTEDVKPLNLV